MKSVKLIVLALSAISLLVLAAWGQGGNPPASTKESGATSGHGMTPVEQGMSAQAKDLPKDIQQALISLDKQWGESGGDAAKLDKIIGDNLVAVGSKGEAQNKQQMIADNKAASAGVQNASYVADEYKFEMLSPHVVVMTHRGTTKGMENGKEVTESHRSLHVFEKRDGRWQVVANAQIPITK